MSAFHSFLETVVALPILFGILVVVHEWGHFIAARLCGIRVDEFSLGFGPVALPIGKRGDTQYNIRWIPLGGFVKIAGMEPDEEPLIRAAEKIKGGKPTARSETPEQASEPALAVDTHGASIADIPLLAENTPNLGETPEQKKRDRTEGFYAHPLWQRALVIFAGPFMSFVLGYVTIMAVVATTGLPQFTSIIDKVIPNSQAQKIGLLPNDRFIQINGAAVTDGEQLVDIIHHSAGKPLRLVIRRGAELINLTGVPQPTDIGGESVGTLGFQPKFASVRPSISQVVPQTNLSLGIWFSTIGHILERHNTQELRKNLGGPIFIVKTTYSAVQQGGSSPPLLMAQLSLSLALFNLLPIPILDGGHLLMFFIEALRRGRRLSLEQQQNFMLAGLAVIGGLFVLIMFNDITRR